VTSAGGVDRLDPGSVGAYLRRRGVIDDPSTVTATPLGGGVSNVVLLVEADRRLVVKQPLADLAVDEDWPADVGRVHNEAAAARAYDRLLGDDVRVPAVVDEDRDRHVVVFEAAPVQRTWKADLLDERVEPDVAARLGRALADAHAGAASDDDLRATFEAAGHGTPFEQLRLDPYHRTVAERHPEVATAVAEEIERLRTTRLTLVHGDYSPKNVLVDDGDRPTLWLLDFEVACWGDPAFDAAFVLNHLCIKAVHRRDPGAYLGAARAFRDAYAAGLPDDGPLSWPAVEPGVARELGVLALARVDGKSPVEYLDAGGRERVRTAGLDAVERGIDRLEDYLDVVAEAAR